MPTDILVFSEEKDEYIWIHVELLKPPSTFFSEIWSKNLTLLSSP